MRTLSTRGAQDKRCADRLRKALQADQASKHRNERLEQIDEWQTARLAGPFEDGPGAFDIRHGKPGDRRCERQQKCECADQIDQRPCARSRLRVKNVDPYVAVDLERPCRREHEQRRMSIKHQFLESDRTHPERVAHDDDGELDEYDEQAAPYRTPADRCDDAIDAVGDVFDSASHRFPAKRVI